MIPVVSKLTLGCKTLHLVQASAVTVKFAFKSQLSIILDFAFKSLLNMIVDMYCWPVNKLQGLFHINIRASVIVGPPMYSIDGIPSSPISNLYGIRSIELRRLTS